jgi:alpha-L-fucosidase
VWRPAECDVSIRPGWFWHPAEDAAVRTVENLLELYLASVGRNGGLLLNVPPTTAGLLHPTDVARLGEFGTRRRAVFGQDLAREARISSSPGRDPASASLQLDFPHPVTFDLISLQEAIAEGQSISSYAVDSWTGRWGRIAEGTTIGHRRIVRVEPATTTRLRLSLGSRRGPPRLLRPTLHHT